MGKKYSSFCYRRVVVAKEPRHHKVKVGAQNESKRRKLKRKQAKKKSKKTRLYFFFKGQNTDIFHTQSKCYTQKKAHKMRKQNGEGVRAKNKTKL